jgi:Flp pilus assembly protein TadD
MPHGAPRQGAFEIPHPSATGARPADRALEGDGRWEELAAMARDWTGAAPDDGNAWLALAKAAAQLGDSVVADDALRRAAELCATQPMKMQSR